MKELRTKIAKKASKVLQAQELPEGPVADLPEGDLPAEEPKEDAKGGDVEDKLDELTKKVDALAEALEQLLLVEEDEGHKDLKDLKEEDEEEEDKDLSGDELGVEPPVMASKKAEKSDLGDHDKTVADDFEKDKSDKSMQKLEAPAPQITKVKKDELPAMLKLADVGFEQTPEKDKWIILDASDEKNEKPVYEIAKGEHGDDFATAAFVENLVKRMQAEGVDAVLQSVGAVEYTDPVKAKEEEMKKAEAPKPVVPAPVVPPALPKKEEEKKDEATVPVVKASDIQRKFVRAFNLAILAMNKNLVDNPLKKCLGAKLDDLGMDESEIVSVVETVFSEAAKAHFDTALAQTAKYLAMSDEAFVETESMISDVNVVEPRFTAAQKRAIDEEASSLRARASKGSMPVSTASNASPEKRDLLSSALPKPKNWARKDIFGKFNK